MIFFDLLTFILFLWLHLFWPTDWLLIFFNSCKWHDATCLKLVRHLWQFSNSFLLPVRIHPQADKTNNKQTKPFWPTLMQSEFLWFFVHFRHMLVHRTSKLKGPSFDPKSWRNFFPAGSTSDYVVRVLSHQLAGGVFCHWVWQYT